jgi:hypothetical protein
MQMNSISCAYAHQAMNNNSIPSHTRWYRHYPESILCYPCCSAVFVVL